MQLKITTTSIRKLVEIQMEALKRKGIINEEEREAIKNINGHSSRIVEDCYLKMDRDADASHGRNAFGKLLEYEGLQYDTNTNQLEGKELWRDADDLQHAPWGTNHPSFGHDTPKNMRAPWSPAEIDYLLDWIDSHPKLITGNTNKIAKCLHHIENDEKALPIFHLNHVLNSGRLRTGFEKALQYYEATKYARIANV